LLLANLGWTCILEEWRPHKMPRSPEQVGRQAIEIFRGLVAQDPGDAFARDDLVWALWRIARYVDHAEAMSNVNEAVAIGEQLVQKYPASAEFRRELANALSVKSLVLLTTNPTPQSATQAMPFRIRSSELKKAILADLKSNRPEALLPERPKWDEARIVGTSPMWAEFDVALSSFFQANLYEVQDDWLHAAQMHDQAAPYYKDLVERNPSVATFTQELADVFNKRVAAARRENDRPQAAAWSKDAVAFWNHQVELHPDLPGLKDCANEAINKDAEVIQWLAQAATEKATSTKP
jgi:tetratricopeptide (TPR) repeat protein